MGLLEGKKLLITGVLMESSIAFHAARVAQQEGAEVVLSSFGRAGKITTTIAKRLPVTPPVIELDVTNDEDLAALPERLQPHFGDSLDGVLHSIGFAPQSCLGAPFLDAPAEDVKVAVDVSAYSFMSLSKACLPLLGRGASIVGMDFDARVAWPVYNWMGVAKAALESVNRYLAKELGPQGIRVNLVSAGPMKTMAAKSIPGFSDLEDGWGDRAPLGWDSSDPDPTAKSVCALLSDWLPATTGSMIMVDGGVHALGI